MEALLSLLQSSVAQMQADAEAIKRDMRAMSAMAPDIVEAVERRGHREFSQFTGPEGRA